MKKIPKKEEKEISQERVNKVNNYIYTSAYQYFMSQLLNRTNSSRNKEINDTIEQLLRTLDGTNLNVGLISLSYIINHIFSTDDKAFVLLELANKLQSVKENQNTNPSYV